MICVVLAAGYATRLYPLTKDFPKPLLPVGGKSILDHLLTDIDRHPAITGHVVISNHRFIAHFEEWKRSQCLTKPVQVIDDGSTDNENRLGAVRDIQFTIESLGLQDDLLVVAGDNLLDFSMHGFIDFAQGEHTSCVMCHEENDIARQRKTAIITRDENDRILTYEEKPVHPKGNMTVPPFYYYRAQDAAMIQTAIANGCPTDAPGSFAAWLSAQTSMHAWTMPGKRYDIGDINSYQYAQSVYGKEIHAEF